MRRNMLSKATSAILIIVTATTFSDAFVPTGMPHQQQRRKQQQPRSSSRRSVRIQLLQPLSPAAAATTSTSLNSAMLLAASAADTAASFNWEDLLYRAESVASSLAAASLQDPSNLATALPVMYGAGLLTSFSPCVWGLLPLTMSYISSAAGDRQDGRTLLPTAAFAAGLAVVFCSLGVAAVELGGVFGANNAVMAVLSNVICLAMGLKLLELVDLPLPSFNALTQTSGSAAGNENEPVLIGAKGQVLPSRNKKSQDEGGSLLRTFLLGGSSALVASPCATPVLTSILAFVANASNPALGAILLLGYTLGYSTPLLLVAGTGGQALVELRKVGGGKSGGSGGGLYAAVAPWVTPLTGGILLWYGTNGMLTAVFGDPSLAGLAILE